MAKVITALNAGSVAALESPTGTGKTLSLLCSTLAWVEKNKMGARMNYAQGADHDDGPDWSGKYFKKTVFYASRTHSQLSKAMSELRRTDYRSMKATVLGSRDQMCVHPDLPVEENNTAKNVFCQAQLKAKTCRFYPRVEAMKSDRSFFLVKDIEDLVAKSKKSGCCPFYMSRYLQEEADIIFLPYNYIFDAGIRRKLNLNFNGAIVILDEGHNIDRVCEESASFSLSSTDIAVAIRDVTEDMQRMHDEFSDPDGDIIERSYSTEDLMFMKEKLMALEQEFDAFMKTVKEKSLQHRPDVLRVLLEGANITEENHGNLEMGLAAVHEVVIAHNSVNNRSRQACTLQKVAEFIAAPFELKVFDPKNQNSFVVHTELEYPATKRNHFGTPVFTPNPSEKPKGIVFNLWCLNPALGMQVLHNTHAVILTSGTLSPLTNVIMELGLKSFPACIETGAAVVSAEFGHVVPHEQFMIFAVGKGPNSIQLQYNFQNKDNLEYWEELGLTILNFIRLIPDGVLVFFPSYQAMNKAINTWKFKGLWDRLSSIKPMFSEDADKRRFNNAVDGYRQAVGEGRGGVLMGICRGKMSEGIDFSDQYGRAVIVCGLPYPPYYDPRVKSKMKYIDCLRVPNFKGQDWYRAEATKAVNQAIGRVIRHAQDVGVIIMCDTKFEQPGIVSSVSAWLRPVKSMENFGLAIASLRRFFRRHPTLFKRDSSASPSKAPVCQPLQLPVLPIPSSSSGSFRWPLATGSGSGSTIPLRQPGKPVKSCLASLADADADDAAPKKHRDSPMKSVQDCISLPETVVVTKPAKRRDNPRQASIPHEFTFEKITPELKEKAKRMNAVKYLLHEMRRTLEDESYNIFTNVLRSYQRNKNLAKFIEQLTILYPKEDNLFADWFRDCHKFLVGADRTNFIEFCANNGYGVVITVSRVLQEHPEP
ncbi:hypothetical protein GE061_012066 [Apolygus lucorum]|uniref:Helicase ATP-binding domain-containing protein n=1 Tax=Apolygus lucorum TaxID=248454 RepID=A0A8S9XRI1_APOLU|nr:hypothetical protein GE061_012066 [Apolygus lucorum]